MMVIISMKMGATNFARLRCAFMNQKAVRFVAMELENTENSATTAFLTANEVALLPV